MPIILPSTTIACKTSKAIASHQKTQFAEPFHRQRGTAKAFGASRKPTWINNAVACCDGQQAALRRRAGLSSQPPGTLTFNPPCRGGK